MEREEKYKSHSHKQGCWVVPVSRLTFACRIGWTREMAYWRWPRPHGRSLLFVAEADRYLTAQSVTTSLTSRTPWCSKLLPEEARWVSSTPRRLWNWSWAKPRPTTRTGERSSCGRLWSPTSLQVGVWQTSPFLLLTLFLFICTSERVFAIRGGQYSVTFTPVSLPQ